MSETINHPCVDPRKFAAYDQALLGILQNEGKIELFLDMMFSFLYRKTDYFRLLTPQSPNKNLGFPPGVAGKIVEHYFEKYMKLSLASYEDMINKMKEQEDKQTNSDEVQKIEKVGEIKIEEKSESKVEVKIPESSPKPKNPSQTTENESLSHNGQ